MAAIDKIYVDNWEQYIQFKEWCEQQPLLYDKYNQPVTITNYLYHYSTPWDTSHPVFTAPYHVDAYVIKNCPFDFIQKELMINYGHWSQERIKNFYNDIINWDNSKGECPYWAKPEDFIILEDGTMTIKGLEESDYSKIKRGVLYNAPTSSINYTPGKHFKYIKHPARKRNTPLEVKRYFIDITLPDEIGSYMWYHKEHNSWDFPDELVKCEWHSSTAYCRTIKALKRLIIKWKLPVGTIVKATGRYIENDEYIFIVKE